MQRRPTVQFIIINSLFVAAVLIITKTTTTTTDAFVFHHNNRNNQNIHSNTLLLNNNNNNNNNNIQQPLTVRYLNNFFNSNNNKENEEETEEEEYQDNAYDDDDPVEKIFSFFFGKREEKPMGMSRFGKDRFPEQYPATKTDFNVEPVSTDDILMKKLRPLLKNTNLEKRSLKLSYDAEKDGWDAYKFHSLVDKKGGALVYCKTRMGVECGGYNPKGWVGFGEMRGSVAAFLYKFNIDGTATKLCKVGGPGLAQMDYPEQGISFGPDSLVIPLNNDAGNNPKVARSKLGSYYERYEDGTNTLFGKGASQVQLSSLKVYHGVYEDGEYIPFTDAEPFALY